MLRADRLKCQISPLVKLLNIVKTKQNNITMFSYTHCIMKRFVRQLLMFQKSHLRR